MISPEQENRETAWRALHAKIQDEKIKKAFQTFRANGIEPILIKGWAAARFYPNPRERIFGDIDLCIAPELFQKAVELFKDEEVKKLNVDLHKGFRHFDIVSWENLFENSCLVKLDDSEIRVLRAEDHLRVLCVHWLNDGGADKEKLRDIFYAVENRPENFDWDRCLQIVSEKRRKWIVCAIGLTQKYLGLSLKNTPIEREAGALPEWLVSTVEKEWKSNVRLKPLQACLKDRKQLIEQLLKRLPPNPIQSTIELEGSFDARTRIFYQIGSVFPRIIPSLRKFKILFSEQFKRKS
jgi:hypothetical protein